MEELQEADVLWPNHHRDDRSHQQQVPGEQPTPRRRPARGAPGRLVGARGHIPAIRFPGDGGVDDGAESASSSTFVPPHEIAARRRCSEEKAASSLCVGHGRTLKGRDLRSVRTAVLRMTGFLES